MESSIRLVYEINQFSVTQQRSESISYSKRESMAEIPKMFTQELKFLIKYLAIPRFNPAVKLSVEAVPQNRYSLLS